MGTRYHVKVYADCGPLPEGYEEAFGDTLNQLVPDQHEDGVMSLESPAPDTVNWWTVTDVKVAADKLACESGEELVVDIIHEDEPFEIHRTRYYGPEEFEQFTISTRNLGG